MEGASSKQVARYVALGALFLLPITPLVVADSLFFPFITGKAFYIRILVEVLFVAWVVLALLDRAYRPRFSWLGVIVLLFVAWMGVADAFAPNAVKAFWSNFERMEGFVLLAHLAAFFFAASNVLRAEAKWRQWFFTMLLVSLVIAGYALLQLAGVLDIHQGSVRIDATLGNSAYLAVYLLFSFFIALWLAATEDRRALSYSFYAIAALHALLIFFTATRGTIAGFLLSVSAGAVLLALANKGRVRAVAISVLGLILVLGASVYTARNTEFVQGGEVLKRIASISLSQLSTRFTIWDMALAGAKERPLLGWGQEGFNYVFNKYYEPSLYRQEPWFDRAHNAFLDWLSAGGVPAFLLYVSLFVTAAATLFRRKDIPLPERIVFGTLLLGYAVHNIFVFDNLTSYLYFFAVLALIDATLGRPVAALERAPTVPPAQGSTYVLPVGAVALILLIYMVNVPGMRAAGGLITALASGETPAANLEAFRQILNEGPAFAQQETREQLVTFASIVLSSPSVSQEHKEEAVTLAVREMQEQAGRYPEDARIRLQLMYAYRFAGDYTAALANMEKALTLSPRKEQMWLEAGDLYWQAGDLKAAQAAFLKAYELGSQFSELAIYAAAGHIAVGDLRAADRILESAYGTTSVDHDVLAVAYYRAQAWPRLIALSRMRAEKPGADIQAWFTLAGTHYDSGDRAGAIAVLRETATRFPEARAGIEAAIKQIQEGRTP